MIVRSLEALFSLKINRSQFRDATDAVDKFANNANTAMAALAGHFAVQGIKNFIDHTTQAMADVGRMAGMLGISTQALEELRYAAEKSGVSIDTLDDSMKELQIRAVDAKSGEGEAAEAFQKVGVKPTDALGKVRKPLELLNEVADKLKKLPSQSERLWVADAMFGDQGAEMLKIMEHGSSGLAQMQKEARDLGYIMDDGSIESAKRFREGINACKAAFSAILRTIAKSVMPAMTGFVRKMTGVWMWLSSAFVGLNNNSSILRAGLISLGLILAGIAFKALIAFAPFLGVGLLIAGIALLIDDLWTAFQGGESVSEKVFDAISGFLRSCKDSILGLLRGLWDFLPANLQENLILAWGLLKDFVTGFISIVVTICRRAWGFICDVVSFIAAAIKNAVVLVFETLWNVFSNIGPILARLLVDAFAAVVETIKNTILGIKDLIAAVVPDFVKKGFSLAVDYVSGIDSQYDEKPSQQHLAPQAVESPSYVQNHSNQSVNVSVNVKTGAQPQEIGSEVSKAFRRELEKEKLNAFMGIDRYAS